MCHEQETKGLGCFIKKNFIYHMQISGMDEFYTTLIITIIYFLI